MIAWRHLRTICLVLLLIPIVHLTYLVSRDALATMNASPEAWADEMAAYEREDQHQPLPQNPIEIVGGHRVKLWQGVDEILAPQPVLMRGLGNATVDDIHFYYQRLVAFYRPETLVFLPGDSEFHLRDAKDADQLARSIRKLVSLDRYHRPDGDIFIFAPLETPLHPEDEEKIEESTRLLQEWAATLPRVNILDANTLLNDENGNPNPNYYRFDGVNLNEHGYLRLSMMLKSAIEARKTGN